MQDLVGPACADPGIFARGGVGGGPGPTARKQLWQRFIYFFLLLNLFYSFTVFFYQLFISKKSIIFQGFRGGPSLSGGGGWGGAGGSTFSREV